MDPIEYGRLLQAVETIAKQNETLAKQNETLVIGLSKANEDVRSITRWRDDFDRKMDALINDVKHLNGVDKKLHDVGLRLEDAKEHRKDQLWVRQRRRADEARSGMLYKAKAGILTAVSLAVLIWVATTLWQARDTIPLG